MTTPSPVSDAESSAVLPDADADELPEPDEDGVFRYVVGGKISEPRLVKRGEIDSERFMGRQVTGASAVAEVTIDVDGTVRDVKLLHGLDREIDEAFLKAAREYVFEPATLDGEPVPVKYILVLRIQLM
jgi:hypothetical protein